jgi:diacylglycerol kinase (ATP)
MEQSSQSHRPCSQSLARSFYCAFAGIAFFVRTQRNAQIHAIATFLVVTIGLWSRVTKADWCWLTLAMVVVWVAEAMNTALEILADRVTKENDEAIRRVKDVAAGAVLLAVCGAVLVGLLVLWKPLWSRLG